MSRERWISRFWALALSGTAAVSGLGMMVTGLDLSVRLSVLIPLCLLVCAGLCAVLSLRHGGWGVLVAALGIWWIPELRLQLKALLRSIVNYLSMAYGLRCPDWLQGPRADTLVPVLLVLGGLVAVPWILCVLKRKPMPFAIGVSLAPLFACITVTDTVPDPVWVFMWMVSLVLLLLTQNVRRQDSARGNRVTALVLIPGVLVVGLLFLLVPRQKADNWQVSQILQDMAGWLPFVEETAEGPVLNLSFDGSPDDRISLNTMGENTPTDREIMDVTADYGGYLYLRERDYDQYTGVAWMATPERRETLEPLPMTQMDGQVEIRMLNGRGYYFLPVYTPDSVPLEGGRAPNLKREKTYRFAVCTPIMGRPQEEAASQNGGPDSRYLTLPNQTYAEAMVWLEEQGFDFGATVSEKAEQIRILVMESAAYDLKTGRMPGDRSDLAMWFLQDGDTGYCVHFATAATVLLRAAGVPARYVEGYLVRVSAGDTVTVKQRNGHAWTEYYVNGMGWMRLEATPSDGVADTAGATQSSRPTEPAEPTAPTVTEPTVPPTTEPQVTPKPAQKEEPLPPAAWIVPLACVAAVLGVLLQYRLRRSRKLRRFQKGDSNQRTLALYKELVRQGEYLKAPVPESLTVLAGKAKYSRHQLTEEELRLLQARLTENRKALKALPLPKRLVAKWIFVYL